MLIMQYHVVSMMILKKLFLKYQEMKIHSYHLVSFILNLLNQGGNYNCEMKKKAYYIPIRDVLMNLFEKHDFYECIKEEEKISVSWTRYSLSLSKCRNKSTTLRIK